MNDTDYILAGYEDLEISTQIIIRDSLKRGIAVEILDRTHNILRLKKGDKAEIIKQATKTSKDTYISPLVMENKSVSKLLLKEKGLMVPEGKSFTKQEDALNYYISVSEKIIVVKPTTTNFGLGIFIIPQNTGIDIVKSFFKTAFSYSKTIILEEFVDGSECRFLVINNETIAVCNRVPANVTGNGNLSIKELVEKKNEDPRRGIGHNTPLEKIKLDETEMSLLKSIGYTADTIPAKNETVFLRKNSNISTGGDSIDITDTTDLFFKDIAIKGAKAAGAKICGVDMILPNHSQKGEYHILELNFNPVLYIHNFPFIGKNRQVGEKILDLLGL